MGVSTFLLIINLSMQCCNVIKPCVEENGASSTNWSYSSCVYENGLYDIDTKLLIEENDIVRPHVFTAEFSNINELGDPPVKLYLNE